MKDRRHWRDGFELSGRLSDGAGSGVHGAIMVSSNLSVVSATFPLVDAHGLLYYMLIWV